MATGTSRGRCIICGKEKRTVTCDGCQQLFCFDHLTDHRHELSGQLDEIEMNRDIFRQTLNEQTNNPKRHALIKQIDQWEEDSIKKIQRTARKCRELLIQHTTDHINQLEVNLAELTGQIRQIRKENDFNEIDLNQFKQKLTQLSKELDKPTNVSIHQDSASLINKISVVVSSRKFA
jgi:chromosome segregation ATPase